VGATRFDTPELSYADLVKRVRVYRDLSRKYAEDGQNFYAVTSLWAADLVSAQMIIWNEIQNSKNKEASFFEFGTQLATATAEYATTRSGYFRTAKDLVDSSRDTIARSFSENLKNNFENQNNSTNYLRLVEAPSPTDIFNSIQVRTQGLTFEEFTRYRIENGLGSVRLAYEKQDDDPRVAVEAYYSGIMLLLEAYLVESSLRLGDEGLLTLQPRWDFVVHLLTEMESLPDSFSDATKTIFRTISVGLGRNDSARFEALLLQLGAN
jgi:hypothetical protein